MWFKVIYCCFLDITTGLEPFVYRLLAWFVVQFRYYLHDNLVTEKKTFQYAHKLAFQSGACYDRVEPKMHLADTLYFL